LASASAIGTVGDAYDNAMAESFVDSFKTELIADRVWRTRSQLELAVVEYVAWFNSARLHSALGYRPPAEVEAAWHVHQAPTSAPDRAYDPLRGRLRSTVLTGLTDNIKNPTNPVSAEVRTVQASSRSEERPELGRLDFLGARKRQIRHVRRVARKQLIVCAARGSPSPAGSAEEACRHRDRGHASRDGGQQVLPRGGRPRSILAAGSRSRIMAIGSARL
jgi:hypothetical protein